VRSVSAWLEMLAVCKPVNSIAPICPLDESVTMNVASTDVGARPTYVSPFVSVPSDVI
jgi:hypothetical protein